MVTSRAISQQQWVAINYAGMLLSLLLGVTILFSLWSSQHFLNQSQDVWLRAHQLWIMRSCAGFLVLLLLVAMLLLPLLWVPVQQGIGLYCAMIALVVAVLSWIWLLYRSVQGLHCFIKGKAIY
ncbi:hypothetical protein ACF3NA_10925 [Alkanindiges sp. WGS2144]|uniref:hypothetical protein n=1 Tax=Alkanindiges sp. WGS2144 TaxID=3366808 RepID=UPI003750E5A1